MQNNLETADDWLSMLCSVSHSIQSFCSLLNVKLTRDKLIAISSLIMRVGQQKILKSGLLDALNSDSSSEIINIWLRLDSFEYTESQLLMYSSGCKSSFGDLLGYRFAKIRSAAFARAKKNKKIKPRILNIGDKEVANFKIFGDAKFEDYDVSNELEDFRMQLVFKNDL